MKPFEHYNAKTVKEAVNLLSRYKGNAKVNAGGTDLISAMKNRCLKEYPKAIVNIKTIPNLNYIKTKGKTIRIGALTKLSDIAESPEIKKYCRLLSDAARSVASPNVRNMATIAGNLAQDVRCWYYRYPHQVGGTIKCLRKGGELCNALLGENRYHSIFGAAPLENYPCSEGCPAHIDINIYINEIKKGNIDDAARTLLKSNPLPAITGRVCPVFCEPKCNRGAYDEPVAIQCIERTIGDLILERYEEFYQQPVAETGKNVAVFGSGPAGLSAAFFLRRYGHKVTIFEKFSEPGGMLLYSIPPYRLPKDIVKRQIKALEHMGILFKTGVEIEKDITIQELKKKFDAIFIAIGTWESIKLGVPGEDAQGVYYALDYLKRINNGEDVGIGEKVVVIGGGSVAIDAARTAIRKGAKDVHIVCLESWDFDSKDRMLALDDEIIDAEEEGIIIHPNLGIKEILKAEGRVKGIQTVRCLSVREADGTFNPIFDESGPSFVIEAESILIAIGQRTENFLYSIFKITDDPSVFIGGDMETGPSTVIQAIASGKEKAGAINRFLNTTEFYKENQRIQYFVASNFNQLPRIKIQKVPLKERVSDINIEEILSVGFDDIQTESKRCFNCGCLATQPSDIAVALIALDAVIVTTKRRIKAKDLFKATATRLTNLEYDELIKDIIIPIPPIESIQRYEKFTLRKPIDFAIASVAGILKIENGICKDVKIVLGGVAPEPICIDGIKRDLAGKKIDHEIAEEISQKIFKSAYPLSQNAYKVQIAKTLLKRAIMNNP
ncbi:MAG TPA: FAD binding domain-containing protein [Syntrophorhabdaceae bacterium]|nr:FAD binding domain-containing protein [Syntrophorhabdaceae bacterium]